MNRYIAIAGLALLAGCADLSSHVSGSFACGAPQGTCAPTMAIDDGALAKIVNGKDTPAPTPRKTGSVAVPLPAAEAHPYPVRQAHIVFPGYIDVKGQRHDPVGVYVALNDARFVDTGVSGGGETPAVGFMPTRTNLLAAVSAQNDADDLAERVPAQPRVPEPKPEPTSAKSFPASTVQN